MIYLPIAIELAKQRTRELELRALAAEASYLAMSGDPREPRRPIGPGGRSPAPSAC